MSQIAKNYANSVVSIFTLDENDQPIGVGSGFFIEANGVIVTNRHVLADSARAFLKTTEGKWGEILKISKIDETPDLDLVVATTTLTHTKPLLLGDSDSITLGQDIVVIGNPQGLEGTISKGIISGIRESNGMKWLQISAPISPGSSGGPVFNLKGEVIGVATLILAEGQNLNFAIPINYLLNLKNAAPDLSLAEMPFVWSDNPGAFEQHLIRRYKNPLFPKARREITQVELAEARERDNRDYEELNDRLIRLVEDMELVFDYSGSIVSSTMIKFRKRIDDLTQDAMGVGGQANDIAKKAKELRKGLISDLAKGMSGNQDAQRTLEEAERFYHEGKAKFEIPFMAQFVRKDGPIPADEFVPALLMEQPNYIARTIARMDDPNRRAAVQQWALQVLRTALDDGAHIEDFEEKLRALDLPESYLKESRNNSGPLTPLAQDQINRPTPSGNPVLEPEQGDSSKKSQAQMSNSKNRYLAMVEDRIDGQWITSPLMASNPLVVLKFRVSRSGEISLIHIVKSSGHADYDSAAQRAVQAVNPLPPFPSDISESFFDVQYRFVQD